MIHPIVCDRYKVNRSTSGSGRMENVFLTVGDSSDRQSAFDYTIQRRGGYIFERRDGSFLKGPFHFVWFFIHASRRSFFSRSTSHLLLHFSIPLVNSSCALLKPSVSSWGFTAAACSFSYSLFVSWLVQCLADFRRQWTTERRNQLIWPCCRFERRNFRSSKSRTLRFQRQPQIVRLAESSQKLRCLLII